MNKNEAIEIMCNRCSCHEACQGTGCEPKRVLAERDKEIFSALLAEHRKEDYIAELDSVRVSAMISRVADRFVE